MAVLSDPISDFLTRLKNASSAGNEFFTAPHSKIKEEIAKILEAEGYIWNYEVDTDSKFKELKVKVKYSDNGTPVLTDLKRVSKPGIRRYVGAGEIPRVLNGLGISIVSTSKGLKTGTHARKEKLGGEVLAFVW
ncbi:30S ribosomal protein S8 [Oceaniferula spumae]|uniref:Small ribosomal subunit protein uS8 n=1 Tax=Oceaniferula spumae TaxID=2979115 RepID=A0AAT9FS52_9BACT